MPDRSTYTSDEVESCRDNCDALLAAWGANDIEDSTLESLVFGQAVVVIDGHVVAVEDIEGTDGLLARVARLLRSPETTKMLRDSRDAEAIYAVLTLPPPGTSGWARMRMTSSSTLLG